MSGFVVFSIFYSAMVHEQETVRKLGNQFCMQVEDIIFDPERLQDYNERTLSEILSLHLACFVVQFLCGS